MGTKHGRNWKSQMIFFGKVMRNPELCKRTIEVILGIEIDRIDYLEEQKTIDMSLDAKSIRLDVCKGWG